MYVLVGLGNPGAKYALNRHNIGFMAVDSIADTYNFPSFKTKSSALISEGNIGHQKILLCKPVTFMNLSGQAVGEIIRFYKVTPKQVYVVHDDLDLEPGAIKLKLGGGSGGHNGLKSLDQHIGKEYWRVRLGIGHPRRIEGRFESEDMVSNYVLSNFEKRDEEWLISLLRAISEEVDSLFGADPGVWLTKIADNLRQ